MDDRIRSILKVVPLISRIVFVKLEVTVPAVANEMIILGGVKALSGKMGTDENFENDGNDIESIPMTFDSLSDEFREHLRVN